MKDRLHFLMFGQRQGTIKSGGNYREGNFCFVEQKEKKFFFFFFFFKNSWNCSIGKDAFLRVSGKIVKQLKWKKKDYWVSDGVVGLSGLSAFIYICLFILRDRAQVGEGQREKGRGSEVGSVLTVESPMRGGKYGRFMNLCVILVQGPC